MELRVDGNAAHAYTGGRPFDPALPCVVFVHGAGLDHTVWIQQSRYLAHHGYAVLAVDLPGHGRSAGEPRASIEAMAGWVLDAAGAAGIERFAVAGHSMGSLVALATAGTGGERIWHATLLGAGAPMPVADALLDAAAANSHAAIDMINIWGHAIASQVGGNPAPGMWMVGGAVRLLERAGPGVLHNDLAACNAFGDGEESAAAVRCPVHLVAGSRDLMTPPRGARRIAAALEAAGVETRLTELPGSGHMLMSERPNEVLDALADGLSGARPETTG